MSDAAGQLEPYDYELPSRLIAQRPPPRRTDARLLVWRRDGRYEHRHIPSLLELLRAGDLLVLNDTRVFPARLFGTKVGGQARVELLLVRPSADDPAIWEAMVRPGRRVPPGTRVALEDGSELEVGASCGGGRRLVTLPPGRDALGLAKRLGHVPLPPYIRREDDAGDAERYQTVFARKEGSVAAPTAGLHLDETLLAALEARGVARAHVTLHVGPGTFRPVDEADLSRGELHEESFEIREEALRALWAARERRGRVVAVGTTVCRVLETLDAERPRAGSGTTRLFLRPPHRFRNVDVLLTNFHLPRSSLLMLVAAFAGPRWREAYALAVAEEYRFYSYGDANWIEGEGS